MNYDLSEAAEKIAALETNQQCMVDERKKAANDRHKEAKIALDRIRQLEVQCKDWENQLADREATIAENIEKAKTIAENNGKKITKRALEVG